MAEELISKKEVLKLTGISYGQLYRWKRMGLIPEAWFVRRSTFTGQETFFPKEKVLNRIQEIIRLKEDRPLEEVVRLLAPEVVPTEVVLPDPLSIPTVGKEAEGLLWKPRDYSFLELLALASGAQALRQGARLAEAKLLVDLLRAKPEILGEPGVSSAILGEKEVEREGLAVRLSFTVLGREPIFLDGECRVKLRLDLEKIKEDLKRALGGGEIG